jgi:hypothetical protein
MFGQKFTNTNEMPQYRILHYAKSAPPKSADLNTANTWPWASISIRTLSLWACTVDSPTCMLFLVALAFGCRGITAHSPPRACFRRTQRPSPCRATPRVRATIPPLGTIHRRGPIHLARRGHGGHLTTTTLPQPGGDRCRFGLRLLRQEGQAYTRWAVCSRRFL